ncbi:MAG: ABC transporter ATP-binding protein [Methanosarcinales archaeon]
MIKTENLTKIYKLGMVEVIGLKKVNLEVKDGEFLGVMGKSGSGKSTLLHMIGGIDKPTSGSVFIDGVNIAKLKDKKLCDLRRNKIGFIFQSFNLIPTLTTLENVLVPLAPRGASTKIKKRGKYLLERVGLGDRINHTPLQLSGGERQRVAIARALINQPKIVLADEPTGNLDTKSGEEVIQLMREMNRSEGVTFIIVTHDLHISSRVDRTIYLKDGEIIKEV